MSGTDRRIEKTRASIRSAFIAMLSEMDYDDITVAALAKRADIDRKTFYLHYKSKDALLEALETEHVQLVSQLLASLDWGSGDRLDVTAVAKSLAQSFPDVGPIHQRIASTSSYFFILIHELGALRDTFKEILGNRIACTPQELDAYAEFFAGGVLSTYWHWLQSNNGLSIEQMVALAANAAYSGLAGILSSR